MTIDIEEAKNLRLQGHTLQTIGDRFGVTRERVRQKLTKNYGTTNLCPLVPREVFAGLLGCSSSVLERLELEGRVKPLHLGGRYLYDVETLEEVRGLKLHPHVEKVCKECNKTFSRWPSYFRPTSPGTFCSKHCQGVYLGKHYGKNRK